MPPVLGPCSPSKIRLKSCAGCSGTTVVPSHKANSETSGPSRYSSTITSPHVAAWSRAAARSDVTMTPLPAASPSSFTTYGGPNASRAAATSSGVRQTRASAVGTPAAVMTSLAKALEPSSRAATADGPKQVIPTAVTASATPATSGASGPTTTRSAPISSAKAATASPDIGSTSWRVATAAMPGLPGRHAPRRPPGHATARGRGRARARRFRSRASSRRASLGSQAGEAVTDAGYGARSRRCRRTAGTSGSGRH